jgi:hypothetical protein
MSNEGRSRPPNSHAPDERGMRPHSHRSSGLSARRKSPGIDTSVLFLGVAAGPHTFRDGATHLSNASRVSFHTLLRRSGIATRVRDERPLEPGT